MANRLDSLAMVKVDPTPIVLLLFPRFISSSSFFRLIFDCSSKRLAAGRLDAEGNVPLAARAATEARALLAAAAVSCAAAGFVNSAETESGDEGGGRFAAEGSNPTRGACLFRRCCIVWANPRGSLIEILFCALGKTGRIPPSNLASYYACV